MKILTPKVTSEQIYGEIALSKQTLTSLRATLDSISSIVEHTKITQLIAHTSLPEIIFLDYAPCMKVGLADTIINSHKVYCCRYISDFANLITSHTKLVVINASPMDNSSDSLTKLINLIDFMLRTSKHTPTVKIAVLITALTTQSTINKLKKTSVSGIIPDEKYFGNKEMIDAIVMLSTGTNYWPDHILDSLPTRARPSKAVLSKLTSRQAEIVKLICNKGYKNKQIASSLGITEVTVKLHVGRALKKYNVRSRVELIVAYKNRGMLR